MHSPESTLENGAHKILRNFAIQVDHPSSVRRSDLVIIKKKKEYQPNSGAC